MRGLQHLILTVMLANILGAYLLKPTTFIDVMLFSLGMMFVAFGSIAPDIDIRQSLVRKWYVLMISMPVWFAQLGTYLVLGILYEFKHRGVMHSLIGWTVSFAVMGSLADIAFGRTISMVICGGFAFGYLAHLIEDDLATKTRIEWIPTPRVMKSWKFAAATTLILLSVLVLPMTAANTTIEGKSFDDMQKEVDGFLYTIFWFGVKVVCILGGIFAYTGLKHKSIGIIQGLVYAFFMAFVLQGILTAIFT